MKPEFIGAFETTQTLVHLLRPGRDFNPKIRPFARILKYADVVNIPLDVCEISSGMVHETPHNLASTLDQDTDTESDSRALSEAIQSVRAHSHKAQSEVAEEIKVSNLLTQLQITKQTNRPAALHRRAS